MTQPVYAFWFCTLISIFVLRLSAAISSRLILLTFKNQELNIPGLFYTHAHTKRHYSIFPPSIKAAATALSYPTLFFFNKAKTRRDKAQE
jgi:hypothetical protein